jgi:hypothetical protein
MNRPLTYSELANLNDEYILEKLKQGKSTEQIKNEYAIENNLLDKMYGNKTGGKNKFASAFETTLYRKIKENRESNILNNTIKKNQDVNLNLKRLKKFYKDNISNYTDTRGTIKKGTLENLNKDAVEYFKKNYPGSVSTYLAKRGGSGKLAPNTEYIRLSKGPSATESSFQRGRQLIREQMEEYMPSSVGAGKNTAKKFERLGRREETAAKAIGMTKNEYKNLINRLVVYPVRKLFPSLTSTPYVAGAEHIYGLQQAISTNMLGEIRKSALNVVPGPKDFNRLIKGPQLDQAATGLIKNAYQTADVEKKQMYLDKANKLIDDFKKDFPGDYPKYKLTSKNNIVDVNIDRVNKIKEPLFNKASTYIDYLVKTPGFLESNEFSNLPDTAKEIINAKVSKSKSFTNLLKSGIKRGGALSIAPAAAYLGYQALSPSTAEAKVPSPIQDTQTAMQDQVVEGQTPQPKLAEEIKYDSYAGFVKPEDPNVRASQSDVLYWIADNEIPEEVTEIGKMVGQVGATIGGATVALGLPDVKKTIEERKAIGKSPITGTLAKGFYRLGSPLATAAFTAPQILDEETTTKDIVTDPFNYLGLATMETLGTKAGTIAAPAAARAPGILGFAKDFGSLKNVGEAIPGKLSTALRLGLSPRVIAGASRFLGIPGLIASTGYSLYDYLSNKDKETQ